MTDARVWLATAETDMLRRKWLDPAGGRVLLGAYAQAWLADRPDLSNHTLEKYAGLIKGYIAPAFGPREMGLIEPFAVRAWWSELSQTRPSTAAGAYRLLNTIYCTAVADGLVARNPCQVRGGGAEHAAERPVATVAEVAALADAMPPRLRAAVLLAAWCGLRRGELMALRRRDVGVLQRTVEIRQAAEYLADGTVGYKAPKTPAGRRRGPSRPTLSGISPPTWPPMSTTAATRWSSRGPRVDRCAPMCWPPTGGSPIGPAEVLDVQRVVDDRGEQGGLRGWTELAVDEVGRFGDDQWCVTSGPGSVSSKLRQRR